MCFDIQKLLSTACLFSTSSLWAAEPNGPKVDITPADLLGLNPRGGEAIRKPTVPSLRARPLVTDSPEAEVDIPFAKSSD